MQLLLPFGVEVKTTRVALPMRCLVEARSPKDILITVMQTMTEGFAGRDYTTKVFVDPLEEDLLIFVVEGAVPGV